MLRRLALPLSLCLTATGGLFALAAGCSQNTSGAGDAGALLAGRSCNVDDECPGLRCDPIRRQCVCLSDNSCASAVDFDGNPLPFCNNFTGLCVADVAGCKGDLDCPPDSYCDQQVRSCRALKGFCNACSSDLECGGPKDNCVQDPKLNQSYCGQDCVDDTSCSVGATCQTFAGVKQCWPEVGKDCTTFRPCTPDLLRTCSTEADCASSADQRCDPAQGKCVARVQVCTRELVCDAKSRTCQPSCNTDADCQAIRRDLACISHACQPVGECQADIDCPSNKVCAMPPTGTGAGECVPFCASRYDCPLGQICLAVSGRNKCQPKCLANDDCPPTQRCLKAAGENLGSCTGTTGSTCQFDATCGTCGLCDTSTNLCTGGKSRGLCKLCGSDSDCGSGHCLDLKTSSGLLSSRCGIACPSTGCPSGFFCAEICINGSYTGGTCSGTRVAECIPADQSCTNASGGEKCL